MATVVDFTAKAQMITGKTTMMIGTCTMPNPIMTIDKNAGARNPGDEEAEAHQQRLHKRNANDTVRNRFHRRGDDVHVVFAALPIAGNSGKNPGHISAQVAQNKPGR